MTVPAGVGLATTRMTLPCLPDPPPISPLPPQGRPGALVAGRYLLERLLGAGGMGAVWAARDQQRGEPVAIKELTANGEGTLIGRALREAAAARRACHPGVITVRAVVGSAAEPWIVMDRVAGYNLAREVRCRGPLPVPLVADLARQLLAAVAAVHAAGLVHRDISPGNVLLTAAGRLVLADFGLAVAAQECSAQTAFLGSPPYVAPEAVRGGRCTPASDLFAVGATLFAAVEGRRPFDAGSPQATLRALLRDPLPPMRRAGPLEPVLRGLLDKDPATRLTAGQTADRLTAGRLSSR